MQKHKIALDVGDVRIGVAVSDLLGITANPRETYVRKKNDTAADIAYFCEYAKNPFSLMPYQTAPPSSRLAEEHGRHGRTESGSYQTVR